MQIQNFYVQSIAKQLLVGLFIGIWVFMFLYFVEPFDMFQLNAKEKNMAFLGYSLTGLIAYWCTIPIQRGLYVTFKKWNLALELLFIAALLIIAGVVSFVFLKFVLLRGYKTYDFWFFFTKRVFPTLLLILPAMFFLRWAFGSRTEIEKTISETKSESKLIIKGENKAEVLHLQQLELVFIESANNYVKVYYLLHGVLKNELFRNKISTLEKQLPFLLKTHRSFLINPIHFLEWKRESSQTILILKPELKEIPVSKTYKKALQELFS